MAQRNWTEDEVATLRALYPVETAAQVARRLGRTETQVYRAAERYRVRSGRRVRVDAKFLQTLRRLNAEERCDQDIAKAIGCGRNTVGRRRRAMLLPSNAKGWRVRARISLAKLKRTSPDEYEYYRLGAIDR